MPSQASRRSFLKQSALAAGTVIGVPNILSARAPNEKLGIAVIGCGGQGGGNPGTAASERLVALCDVDDRIIAGTLKNLGDKAKDPPVFHDYRKMFDAHAKDIDAV